MGDTQVYPFRCCRCGLCCLMETCPLGSEDGFGHHGRCRWLGFDDDENGDSYCRLARIHAADRRVLKEYGIGVGCCIKARVVRGKEVVDFAGLPVVVKRAIAQRVRRSETVVRG